MIVWGVLTWWYTDGWKQCFSRVRDRFLSVADYFSIGLLIKTLFVPFRQISAGTIDGPMDAKLQAFFDRLISRCIGAVARLVVMAIGIVVVAFATITGAIVLVAWPFMPVLPVVGAVLFFIGWVPWSL